MSLPLDALRALQAGSPEALAPDQPYRSQVIQHGRGFHRGAWREGCPGCNPHIHEPRDQRTNERCQHPRLRSTSAGPRCSACGAVITLDSRVDR